MCDVTNPLCGKDGATYTFGKQKGGTPEILDRLEKGMCNYRDVIIKEFGVNPDDTPGTGAAGGLGAALKIFLHAEMKSGIDSIMTTVDGPMPLSKALENAEDLYYKGAVRMFRMVNAGIKLHGN